MNALGMVYEKRSYPEMGDPQKWMVFVREDPIKMDDNWDSPISGNLQIKDFTREIRTCLEDFTHKVVINHPF